MRTDELLAALVMGTVLLFSGTSWADDGDGGRGERPRRGNPGAFFDRLDANGDGTLTAEEAGQERARVFQRLLQVGDANGDGKLTKDEFAAAAQKFRERRGGGERRGGRRGPGQPAHLFERLDANGDGKVSVEEAPERGKRLVEALLRRAGKKPEDTLTKDEFTKLFPGRPGAGGRPGFGGPLFFRKLDTNRDHKLSREELSKAADLIDELDTNKDGSLDPQELFGFPRRGRFGQPRGQRGEQERP